MIPAIGLSLLLLIVIIILLASIFWLWMLVDAAMNPRLSDTEKIVWVLIVLFTHFVGAVVYFFVPYRKLFFKKCAFLQWHIKRC